MEDASSNGEGSIQGARALSLARAHMRGAQRALKLARRFAPAAESAIALCALVVDHGRRRRFPEEIPGVEDTRDEGKCTRFTSVETRRSDTRRCAATRRDDTRANCAGVLRRENYPPGDDCVGMKRSSVRVSIARVCTGGYGNVAPSRIASPRAFESTACISGFAKVKFENRRARAHATIRSVLNATDDGGRRLPAAVLYHRVRRTFLLSSFSTTHVSEDSPTDLSIEL